MTPRKAVSLFSSLAVLFLVVVFGPKIAHLTLRSLTSPETLKLKQREWSRIVAIEPTALNGPNRESFARYSANAFQWFRVRWMVDPCCDETSIAGDWLELFAYFVCHENANNPDGRAQDAVGSL